MKIFIFLLFINLQAFSATKNDWLINHAETVVLVDEINLSHVKALKSCACFQQAQSNVKPSDKCSPSSVKSEPEFIRTTINKEGETKRKIFNCKNILDVMVFKNAKRKLPELRKAMALMAPEKFFLDKSNHEVSEIFVKSPLDKSPGKIPNLKSKLTINLKHEIKSAPWNAKIPIHTPAPLSQNEIQEYLEDYTEFSDRTCLALMSKERKKRFPDALRNWREAYLKEADEKLCNIILYTDDPVGWRVRADFNNLTKELYHLRLTEYRKGYREEYARIVQENPLLILLKSPTPQWDELIKVLDYITTNAEKRLNVSKKNLHERNNLINFVARKNLLEYSKLKWIAQGNNEDEYNRFEILTVKEFDKIEMNKQALEIGALIAVSVGCALPWGKGIGIALSAIKYGCVFGMGIPLNAFYLIDSVATYDKSLKTLFSSIDPHLHFFENGLEEINGKSREIFWSALFLPVGMEIRNGRRFLSLIKELH